MADSSESACHYYHDSLGSRTTDPEAAGFDEASQLVQTGLRHARSGSLEVGLPLIACAFLLDSRAIEFKPVLDLQKDNADNAANRFLDMGLLQQLIDFEGGNNVASQVLMIYAAIVFGEAEGARARSLQALHVSANIIIDITNDPTMEDADRGILGGCLKRAILHRMRATLYLSLGSPEAAVEELSEALLLNPNLTSIGCERAVLSAVMSYKSPRELVCDFRRVVRHAHPDARELRDAYAWLAKLILEDRDLGSFGQAYRYLQLSRSAKARYEEIYGPTTSSLIESQIEDAFTAHQASELKSRQIPEEVERETLPSKQPTIHEGTNTYAVKIILKEDDERDVAETRQSDRDVSDIVSTRPDREQRTSNTKGMSATARMMAARQLATSSVCKIKPLTFLDDSKAANEAHGNQRKSIACAACGNSATIARPLSMCTRCCAAFYCSKECQRSKEWVQHRFLCKATGDVQSKDNSKLLTVTTKKQGDDVVSSEATSKKQGEQIASTQKKVIFKGGLLPRKPLDDKLQVMELANKRMRFFLRERFRVHGKEFALWWHMMPGKEKKGALKLISKNTIPSRARSSARTAPVLKAGDPRYAAGVLTEWCVERMLSQCKCEKHWFNDSLLHEMRYHLEEERADDIEYQLSVSMVLQGYVPSSNGEEQRLLRPPNDSDAVQAHQPLHPKGTLHQGILSSIKKTGKVPPHLKEKLPFELFLHRTWYRFSLYCLLFELFDERMGQLPTYPLGRLRGCEYCKQDCEDDESVQCQGSKWWCCQGCHKVSIHAKTCSPGKSVASAAMKAHSHVLFA